MTDSRLIRDFLTGCYTREGLYFQIQKLQSDYQRYWTPFSVLVIDIDHFKRYNDKYGHATGDEILRYFSNSVRTSVAAHQTFFFRLGGDEFVVLFPAEGSDEVECLANRMNENLKRMPYQMGDRPIELSFSAGISAYPTNGNTAEELLHRADQAMYFCKRTGRGRVMQYGNFSFVKLQQAVRFLAVLALALFLGTSIGLIIQSHAGIQERIAAMGLATDSFAIFAKKKTSHAIKSIQARLDASTLVKHPGPSPWSATIQKPITGSAAVPPKLVPLVNPSPTIAWDLVYLKSGGIIQGKIVKEDEERLTLQLNISASRGVLVLEKTDISKIIRKDVQKDEKL